MNLLEYEAKAILERFDIPIPAGKTFRRGDKLPTAPIVLKSQVHSGGRGKLGGVRVVTDEAALRDDVEALWDLEIKGERPETLLAEEVLNIQKEYYLSLVIDRTNAAIELVAHRQGGIEVEAHESDEFFRQALAPDETDPMGEALSEYLDLPEQAFALQELLHSLLRCFTRSDAIMLEINPLVLTSDDKLVAGDCKMILDAAARFRHHEWIFEQKPASTNFVTLDTEGTVATIANGAGLAMATVDAVKATGLAPANFLDIGGGATVQTIVDSFRRITEFPKVDSIVINIFGGIVRCDDVAAAIIEARQQFPRLPKLYIRLSGTRSNEATSLLASEHLVLYPDLPSCLKELVYE